MVRKSSVEEPFSALAFKIATDPYLGSLTFARIYSGIVETGTCVQPAVCHAMIAIKGVLDLRRRRIVSFCHQSRLLAQLRHAHLWLRVGPSSARKSSPFCSAHLDSALPALLLQPRHHWRGARAVTCTTRARASVSGSGG